MSNNISSRTKIVVSMMVFLFASTTPRRALSQNVPLASSVETTCGAFSKPTFPSVNQLPNVQPLPDPFVFLDGSGRDTTFTSWAHHRCDYKAAIEAFEVGPKPDASDVAVTASWKPASATDGTLTVVVTRKANQRSLTLTSHIVLPSSPQGAVPAVIAMTLSPSSGPATGSVLSAVFTGRGIATIEYLHNQVTALSFGHIAHTQDPFYLLYPELCAGVCSNSSNSGQYAAWAWGVSRLIDGLFIAANNSSGANRLPIDLNRLGVTGCSYAGKMALFAGAFDERVALTISQENGGGGMPSWRVSHDIETAGSVEDIDTTSQDWFGQQMRQFAGDNVHKLPEDHHELMAMVLPRALLVTGNTDFTWLSNRSGYIDDRATQQIYQTFGIADRFGFYIDGGHAHCAVANNELPAIQAFVDKFMVANSGVNTNVEVNPFATLNFQRWTAWWGTGDPVLPADGPDFSLAATPNSVTVAQGASSTSTINVTATGGFTGMPVFTASGLPAGVRASFSGHSVTFTVAANATVTTTPANVVVSGISGALSRTTSIALSVTPTAQSGSVSAATVINSSSAFFIDEGVKVTNTAPIIALTVTIGVQNTGGLSFSSQYNTLGGAITQSHNGLTYTFTLAPGQTITSGQFLFDAQVSGSGSAHSSAGDTYTVTGTAGGTPFSLSGHF